VWDQKLATFLRVHENAFRDFGGVPLVVRHDKLKAGVVRACLYDPDAQPVYAAFSKHWGFTGLTTRPRNPKENDSLDEQNQHLRHWNRTIARLRFARCLFTTESVRLTLVGPSLRPPEGSHGRPCRPTAHGVAELLRHRRIVQRCAHRHVVRRDHSDRRSAPAHDDRFAQRLCDAHRRPPRRRTPRLGDHERPAAVALYRVGRCSRSAEVAPSVVVVSSNRRCAQRRGRWKNQSYRCSSRQPVRARGPLGDADRERMPLLLQRKSGRTRRPRSGAG
jgi:hypothetical protein